MNFEEYRWLDGLALAALVARREVTAAELLEIAIARAEAVNPKINAIVIPMHDIGRGRAKNALAGPFAHGDALAKPGSRSGTSGAGRGRPCGRALLSHYVFRAGCREHERSARTRRERK